MLVALLGLAAASVSPGDSIVYYPSGSVHRALGTSEASIAFGKPTAAAADSTLLTGLVSYWSLDESSDGSVPVTREDSVGANDLTDNNTTASAAGQNNAAASFVEVNSEQLTKTDFVAPDSFTVAGWVYPSDDPSNSGVIGATGAWPNSSQFTVLFQAANTITGLVSDGAAFKTAVTYDTAAPFAGRWSFFVMWFDAGDKTCHISVNNDVTDKLSNDGALAGTPYRTAATLRVGNATGPSFLNGLVDEVAVWSRVLTADERTCLYAAGAGAFHPWTGVCTP